MITWYILARGSPLNGLLKMRKIACFGDFIAFNYELCSKEKIKAGLP
jgi:hypothetical protein